MKFLFKLISVSLLSVTLTSAAASAKAETLDAVVGDSSSSLPAVDGVNAKLSFEGRPTYGGGEVYGVSGSMSFPLGHQFGLQIDGVAGKIDGNGIDDVQVYAGAAHLFWRDPSRGLIGAYGSVIHADLFSGFTVYKGGLEGGMYLGRWTVEGIAGVAHEDFGDTSAFGDIELAYYPDDDLRVEIGYGAMDGGQIFKLGGEWAFVRHGQTATSAFVDSYIDDDGEGLAIAGLRFYFGKDDKTLIRRHREDDPQSASLSAINFHFSSGQVYGQDCKDACTDAYSATR